jgi:putative DNA primase/helicase
MTVENVEQAAAARKAAAVGLADSSYKFHVFCVERNSKRPDKLLAPHGFKDATQDAETIAGWLDAKPRCNVGIAVGPQYGYLVFDIDVKGAVSGYETLKEMLLPEPTLSVKTPSGGMHLYFRHPGVPLKATLPGIDIKGADGGGYVVAPPSSLPNGSYTWADPEIPIVHLPKDIIEELRTDKPKEEKKQASKPTKDVVKDSKTPEGERHTTLKKLAASYRYKGLSTEEIELLLWRYATEECDPPFRRDVAADANEIEAIARWFADKAHTSNTEVPVVLETQELRQLAKAAPKRAVLNPLLPEAGALMIYGPTGVGKSHIGLCCAGALATGGTFLDWVADEAIRVLYVDGENPLDELETRIASYYGDHPLENLKWIAARANEHDLPNLADPTAQEIYLTEIRRIEAKVVIFDNMSCLRSTSVDANENSVEAWEPVGNFIRRLNRLGIAVILIHHAAKNGSQRGSTAHTGPMDTVLSLRPLADGKADPQAENDIEIYFEKHRRFGGEAAAMFRAKALGDADGNCRWVRVGEDALVDDVVRLLNKGRAIRDIALELGRSKNGIQKAIDRAKSRGLLALKEAGHG